MLIFFCKLTLIDAFLKYAQTFVKKIILNVLKIIDYHNPIFLSLYLTIYKLLTKKIMGITNLE